MCCRVNQFLCGCTLKHGAITATVLKSLAAISLLLIGIVIFVMKDTIADVMDDMMHQHHVRSTPEQMKQLQDAKETIYLILNIFGGTCVAFGLLATLSALFLGIAVCTENACLVIFWLVEDMISMIFGCILIILLLLLGFYFSVLGLGSFAFEIYLWIVVYNFRQELNGQQHRYISAPMKA